MANIDSYNELFKRNIGILSNDEQAVVKNTRIGVAGVGGLGGQTFINLVRVGFGHFSIADIDTFDIANTNRQIGASQSSFGKTKVSIMSLMAKDINPNIEINEFNEGIQPDTVDRFVSESDIIVDSLDFFSLTARQVLYASCHKHGKTVILSAPLGFSATLHAFSKDSMSAQEFFSWQDGMDKFEQFIRFAVGISPRGLHLKYLSFDKQKLISSGTGPSISFACGLGAAMLSGEVLFTILKRRPTFSAPYFSQFDLFRGQYVRGMLRWGNQGPLQRLKIFLALREFSVIKTELMELIK